MGPGKPQAIKENLLFKFIKKLKEIQESLPFF
jgi:hypothetical protein